METDASFESMGLDDDDDLVDRKAAAPEIDLEFEQSLQATAESVSLTHSVSPGTFARASEIDNSTD